MCGICGIVNLNGLEENTRPIVEQMTQTLHHRGPDESGAYNDNQAALGHARLSIIDLTEGRQPLSNEDGTIWIVYNGEVYNFPALREELERQGHQFRTHTDTEVIVHLYERDGIDAVHSLRGMFAFALWDTRKQTFYLVRDRLGIKPLYYTHRNNRLLFGSEIKAILAGPNIPRRLRDDALSDYLTLQYVPAPKTMFADILKLEPGHWLRLDANGLHTQQYWDLTPQPYFDQSDGTLQERLLDELLEAVRLRLISDVPLGAFLSGGVDSAAVLTMMAQAKQDPRIAVSIGFNEAKYNELPYARLTARRYATEHHEEIVTPQATDIVHKLAYHFDEPFADFSSIPTYYVSQAARRHVTVILSGDGGDELFGGYPRYRWHLFEQRVRRFLPPFIGRPAVGALARIYPDANWLPHSLRARQTLQKIALDPLSAYLATIGFINDQQKRHVLHPDIAQQLRDYRSSDILAHYMQRGRRRGLDQLSYTDIKTYLVDDILTKVDRTSMAVSLEARVPLLDHRFVEFAAQVPPRLKIQGREGKAILKSALRGRVDDEVLYKPKSGFSPPLGEWMRDPLRDMLADLVLSPQAHCHQYLQRRAIEEFFQRHQAGQNYTHQLWAILMFELWCRNWLSAQPKV